MSLATICVNVAQDLGIDEPAPPIFGSQLPAAKRLVAQARRAAWALTRRADWAPLVIEHEFAANGQSDYDLPPDFLGVINDTVWERTRYWAMRGSLSPQQWQRYRSSIYGRATIWRRWRIRVPSGGNTGTGTKFSIDPLVAASDFTSQFVFEYKSSFAIQHADGTMGADWTADNDTYIALDEFLLELGTRWRMLRRLGLAYDDERDEYEREVDKAVARVGGMMTLNLVPFYREDFIGQYSLGAFPPVGTPPQTPAQLGPAPQLPPEIARAVAPMERPDWRPPADLSMPPPLAPRPPAPPPSSEAERVQALLARAPPLPAPAVRRRRRRHQPPPGPPPLAGAAAEPPPPRGSPSAIGPVSSAPPLRPPMAPKPPPSPPGRLPLAAVEVPPPSPLGSPHPAAVGSSAPPPRPPLAPEPSQGWLPFDDSPALRPPPPEPQLPPGT